MDNKRPYKHILKNLFHEQATELVPLLMPGYWVEKVLDIEMPDLISTPIGGPPSDLDQGLVGLILPGAQLIQAYTTEWIEHSGKFERLYRIHSPETEKPSYLLMEFQTDLEDEKLPLRFLSVYATANHYAQEDSEQEDEEVEEVEVEEIENESEESDEDEDEDEDDDDEDDEPKGTIINHGYYVYPIVLCPFPQAVPPPVKKTFQGKPLLTFNFMTLFLWEKDAREFLNTHSRPVYFLLPAMKNADAALIGLAIEELAQQFKNDDVELGRHLTGMHLLLQTSEMMSEEEKLTAQEHLKPYMHLIKNNPDDE